ncbi:hypothetical protein PIROE2DRAFT_17624 [Piromyces sp. E2]|nr:hypothetical protein PIROE2DRAFT_17624 [Piromyces sp. E2]|eukprot:OUM57410.1 hypothetical protein PIROE2DRAFT_17624 [Piromyces sp. E2]
MKFLGTFILLAIINFCSVLAAENNKTVNTKTYRFLINTSTHKATIVTLNDKSVVNVNIPQVFTYNNKKYYINEIGSSAFAGSKIKSLTIGSNIKEIKLYSNAFADCKELKTFTINAPKVSVNISTFQRANLNMVIKGSGVPAFVKSISVNLLKTWGFQIKKDYSKVSQAEKKKDLFNLAKRLNKYVTFDGNTDQGNAAVALALRHASWGGISRAYYNLAINMNIKGSEILIGGDATVSAWNYVKVDGKWYNVDVSRFDFTTHPDYTKTFFYTNSKFSAFLNEKQPSGELNKTPSKWVVVKDLIHYQGEANYHGTTNFDSYLKANNLGSRA